MIVQAYDFHGTSNASASSGETLTMQVMICYYYWCSSVESSQSFQVNQHKIQLFGAVTFADPSLDMLGDINLDQQ